MMRGLFYTRKRDLYTRVVIGPFAFDVWKSPRGVDTEWIGWRR